MNATKTAISIIEWAMTGSGFPPRGYIGDTDALILPEKPLADAMQMLVKTASAQHCWGAPPLGNPAPLGPGGAILAASLGMLHAPGAARVLLQAVPKADNPGEWMFCHFLVSRVLPFLPDKTQDSSNDALLKDDLLILSPLTALLTTPLDSMKNAVTDLAYQLIASPPGRRWLQVSLAEPVSDAAIRNWRRELLGRLQKTEGDMETAFVLDVYEALMIHHGKEILEQVADAREVLLDPIAASKEECLGNALSVAGWWRPLWEMRRSRNDDLRARVHLGYEYLKGLELCTLAQKLTGRI